MLEHGGLATGGVIAHGGRERHHDPDGRLDTKFGRRHQATGIHLQRQRERREIEMRDTARERTQHRLGPGLMPQQWLSASSSGCISATGNGDEEAVGDMRRWKPETG